MHHVAGCLGTHGVPHLRATGAPDIREVLLYGLGDFLLRAETGIPKDHAK